MAEHAIRLAKAILPPGTGAWLRSLLGPLVLGGPIPRSLPPGCNNAALTFDDGPHPDHTPRILEILARWGVRASFFVVGREAERHPELVRAVRAAGHELGNHTHTHPNLLHAPVRSVVEEITRANRVLSDITGEVPRFFRPPFGTLTLRVLWACRRTGMRPVFWSLDSLDYSSNAVTAPAFLDATFAGQIVLFHDNRAACPALLDVVLPGLLERGYACAPLGDVL